MKIYSMTATFGKLENQTLTLQPGLNVISAPNEWGKSTWCAFLVNMLYGLETRVKTTKTTIADKDRYAPWSGSPMSGRIDLNWNGQDITIERWSKGRTPMGEFRAYETNTGMEVPELTATTCGEMLLGVERSVFMRSGFLRLTDLPVTEDEALRRRLNALVTTGDESGAADELGQKLKELKNKCRSNRTNGLLPQAEAQKAQIEEKLSQLKQIETQSQQFAQRLEEVSLQHRLLENHMQSLQYAAAEENNRRIASAQAAADFAAQQEMQLRSQCSNLPDGETALRTLEKLQHLQQQQQQVQLQAQMLPPSPQMPTSPCFAYGMTGTQALQQVQTDIADYYQCATAKKMPMTFLWAGGAAAGLGAVMMIMKWLIPGTMFLLFGISMLIVHFFRGAKQKTAHEARMTKAESICARYGGGAPDNWLADAQAYEQRWLDYETSLSQYQQSRLQMQQRINQLEADVFAATDGQSLIATVEYWKKVLSLREQHMQAQKEMQRTAAYAENMAAMVTRVPKPQEEDHLPYSEAETLRMLEETKLQQQRLRQNIDHNQGRMEIMGQESKLQRQLCETTDRIARLTETYAALELAQSTLAAATAQLQRRFAPRISSEAQDILRRMTHNRYQRLTIDQDMTLSAGTEDETVLRAAQRRSEGTMDQIYLALRLAVSKELTPRAPLVLDDALVRFDDVRHQAAMQILKEESAERQIILFTCQSREKV